jgi:2-polyprenyl-3-methyl-5-hydroxy-6-metoxy-1,4-benzoquinol methylase
VTLATVPCPLCAATVFRPVYPGTIRVDDQSDPVMYFSSSRGSAGYLPVVRCTGCGLMMENPRDDEATLGRTYAKVTDGSYEREEENRIRSAREHLALVTEYAPPSGRLLDVGCSTGIFAGVAQARGWEVVGVDPSTWAIARARARCPGAVFESHLLHELRFHPDRFDVITLWDVLEHVSSPVELLQRLKVWLVPGGWLFLSLPNADSMAARLMGKRWVLLLREHLWYFAPPTIGRLLAGVGFSLVHHRPKRVRFSLTTIASRLGQYPGAAGALANRLSRLPVLERVSARFPIGEMYVVARMVDHVPKAAAQRGVPGRPASERTPSS